MDEAEARTMEMSARELKAFLDQHNVNYVGVTEKQELRTLVKETMRKAGNLKRTNMLLEVEPVGHLNCNMVVLADMRTQEAVVVDPGAHCPRLVQTIQTRQLKVVQILVTHAHFDHFMAAGELKKVTGAPICLHSSDVPLWKALPIQLQMIGLAVPHANEPVPDPDEYLTHQQSLPLFGGKVIHTPGHSPGSVCFYFERLNLLLSGDTLFRRSVGRTDLWGGDSQTLTRSIQDRLYMLPDDVEVIPGHGPRTTIGEEKQSNSVVRAAASAF